MLCGTSPEYKSPLGQTLDEIVPPETQYRELAPFFAASGAYRLGAVEKHRLWSTHGVELGRWCNSIQLKRALAKNLTAQLGDGPNVHHPPSNDGPA